MSKRQQSTQGGPGFRSDEPRADAPNDPPKRASAAMMAKRKIVPLKGRKAFAEPTHISDSGAFQLSNGGGFGGAPSMNFNFGNAQSSAPPAPSFSFGASQPTPPNNSFSFQAANNNPFNFSAGSNTAPATSFSTNQPEQGSLFGFQQTDTHPFNLQPANNSTASLNIGNTAPTTSLDASQPQPSAAPSFSFSSSQPTQSSNIFNFQPKSTDQNIFSFGTNNSTASAPSVSAPQPASSNPFSFLSSAVPPSKSLFSIAEESPRSLTAFSAPPAMSIEKSPAPIAAENSTPFNLFSPAPTSGIEKGPTAAAAEKPAPFNFFSATTPASTQESPAPAAAEKPAPFNLFSATSTSNIEETSAPAAEKPAPFNFFSAATPSSVQETSAPAAEKPAPSNFFSATPFSNIEETSAQAAQKPAPLNFFSAATSSSVRKTSAPAAEKPAPFNFFSAATSSSGQESSAPAVVETPAPCNFLSAPTPSSTYKSPAPVAAEKPAPFNLFSAAPSSSIQRSPAPVAPAVVAATQTSSNAQSKVASASTQTASAPKAPTHESLRSLNQSFMKYISNLDDNADWSLAALAYAQKVLSLKKRLGLSSDPMPAHNTSQNKRPAKTPVESEQVHEGGPSPKKSKTSSLFQAIAEQSDPASSQEDSDGSTSGRSLFDRIAHDQNGKPIRDETPPTPAPAPAIPALFGGPKVNIGGPLTPSTTAPAVSGAGGWKPDFGSTSAAPASSNFLGAFASLAKKNEEAEKAKRKAEEFDSDEDDLAEWEKNYDEQQKAKRAKIAADAAAAKPFVVSAPSVQISPPTPGKENVAPNAVKKNDTTSLTASRATTPGLGDTSAAESTTDGDDAPAAADPQLGDLTALSEAERKAEDVLHEIPRGKARILTEDGKTKVKTWKDLGLGPIRILKNKDSAATRVLMRISPGGRVAINARLSDKLPVVKATAKQVRMCVPGEGTTLDNILLTFADEATTDGFVKACETHT